jgi:SAM-dependent methyltransferase
LSGEAVRAYGIEFHAGTAERPPPELSGEVFDVITMFQSLEHCRSPGAAVRNAISLLKPRGLLVIDVPNMGCIGFEKYGPAWWHADAGRHLQFFTKKSLGDLLKQSGAVPIKWECQGFVSQFTSGWIEDMAKAWDAMGPMPNPATITSQFAFLSAACSGGAGSSEI